MLLSVIHISVLKNVSNPFFVTKISCMYKNLEQGNIDTYEKQLIMNTTSLFCTKFQVMVFISIGRV